MPLEHLTLLDLSDREFLLVMYDVSEDDGWTDSLAVAHALDLAHRRTASSRLSWLARKGIVEREHRRDERTGQIRYHRNGKPMTTQRWRMTDFGWAYAQGVLKARTQAALDKIDDAALIELTRYVTERLAAGEEAAQWLAKRQWRYGTEQRRNGTS